MAHNDLRFFVEALERSHQLVRISAEVDPILEITEIADRVSKAPAVGSGQFAFGRRAADSAG